MGSYNYDFLFVERFGKNCPFLATFSKNQDFLIFGKNHNFSAGGLDFEIWIFYMAYTGVTP